MQNSRSVSHSGRREACQDIACKPHVIPARVKTLNNSDTMCSTDLGVFDALLDNPFELDDFDNHTNSPPAREDLLESALKETQIPVEQWNTVSGDELLDSLFNGQQIDDLDRFLEDLPGLDFPPNSPGHSTYETEDVPASSASDSGLSVTSDLGQEQQFSPLPQISVTDCDSSMCSESTDHFCHSPLSETSDIQLEPSSVEQVINIGIAGQTGGPSTLLKVTPMPTVAVAKAGNQVQQSNTRSLLLPVILKDLNLKDIRTVKIIRNGGAQVAQNLKTVIAGLQKTVTPVLPSNIRNIASSVSASLQQQTSVKYPPIDLTNEERKMLQREGIQLPSHYPLTKQEERELKRIRRKIRNKISAQDSRKRKREYMDGLEDRVKACTTENTALQKRIRLLETQNQSLMNQLKKLQSILKGQESITKEAKESTLVKPAPGSTCLMVLLLSLALCLLPQYQPNNSEPGQGALQEGRDQIRIPLAGRSRSLLQEALFYEEGKDVDASLLEFLDEEAVAAEVVVDGRSFAKKEEEFLIVPEGPVVIQNRGHNQRDFKYGRQYGKRTMGNIAALMDHDYEILSGKKARFKADQVEVKNLMSEVPSPASSIDYESSVDSKFSEPPAEDAWRMSKVYNATSNDVPSIVINVAKDF